MCINRYRDIHIVNVYNHIYDFCKVRNAGSCFSNDPEFLTPRVEFIVDLLDELKLEWHIDTFPIRNTTGYNIVIPGSGNKMVTAHHDIVNPHSDNANDNSCSVINAIALKQLEPSITVVLTDGEEFGGLGAKHLSKLIADGDYGVVDWILNLELTGRGTDFFIGSGSGVLFDLIKKKFDCIDIRVPFNDSVIFNANGIDSIVINPLPKIDGKFDYSVLNLCHSIEDSVDKINTTDMKEFTTDVLREIVR